MPVYDPNGLPHAIAPSDFYLAESFQIQEGAYQNSNDWLNEAILLDNFPRNTGFGVMSTTTNAVANVYSHSKFNYAWFSSMLFDHEATAWGEYSFSSGNGLAPYRPHGPLRIGDFSIDVAKWWRDVDARFGSCNQLGRQFFRLCPNSTLSAWRFRSQYLRACPKHRKFHLASCTSNYA